MNKPAEEVRVRVPATTANLGPGFDCLGLALTLYNDITVVQTGHGVTVHTAGEGAGLLPADDRNLVVRAAECVFAAIERRPPGLRVELHNRIPVGSGLGSSAAAVLGGMLAANAFYGDPLPRDLIVQMAAEMEGHPDNVAPAAAGGLVLSFKETDTLRVVRLAVPPLQAVVVLPDFALPTEKARELLPAQLPMADAVFNIGRAVLLVHALENGDLGQLEAGMQDRLHQPYRMRLIPGAVEAAQAARANGAAGVALSGAGPSLVALAVGNCEQIQAAMREAFARAGLASRGWVLDVDSRGAVVESGVRK
jgi:homoserine kinase